MVKIHVPDDVDPLVHHIIMVCTVKSEMFDERPVLYGRKIRIGNQAVQMMMVKTYKILAIKLNAEWWVVMLTEARLELAVCKRTNLR